MTELKANQLLRIQDASSLTTIGKSTIRLWIVQGKFPKPMTLSPTIKVWRAEQILDWIEQQKAHSEKSPQQIINVEQSKVTKQVMRTDFEATQ